MARGEKRVCAATGCEEEFVTKTFNQIYHDDECTRKETNRRIMEKYYAKRDQRLGKPRYCKKCIVTKLSRYNDNDICASCESQAVADINSSVLEMIAKASLT